MADDSMGAALRLPLRFLWPVRRRGLRRLWGLLLVVPALRVPLAQAAWEIGLQTPVTESARQAYELHGLMMWLVSIIFVGVFGVLGYAAYAHRKSRGHQAAQFHDSLLLEIVWTVIPVVILVIVAFPATSKLLEIRDATRADLTIQATGYQWRWGYTYLSGDAAGIQFMSVLSTTSDQIHGRETKGPNYLLEVDRPLVVPVNQKIRILTTSADVVHDWSVPAFGVKQDAVPGFLRETWFRAEQEGTFRGQCSELCGRDHGFMPIVVEVVSVPRFAAWVAERRAQTQTAAGQAAADAAATASSAAAVPTPAALAPTSNTNTPTGEAHVKP